MSKNKIVFVLIIILLLGTSNVIAWIYPEHREITMQAIMELSPDKRQLLDSLWLQAREGFDTRLTSDIVDTSLGLDPDQLDFAAWPAIAGDHSCSSEDMMHNILNSKWILKVAHVAAQLKTDLANSENRHEHVNALRDSDIKLQRADPQYATRAGSNNVHFLLALPSADTDVKTYLHACLQEGAELNALGAYSWFHISALEKAAKFFHEAQQGKMNHELIRAALADEAYALHFLQDAFASGHTAGTWGNASQRKGTHDYYNEKGLVVTTWKGNRTVVRGDAFMRQQDAQIAAQSVRQSLVQVIKAANGKLVFDYQFGSTPTEAPDPFNTCKNNFMPKRSVDPAIIKILAGVLVTTPVPGLATGIGELPRFRSELGTFIGITSALRGTALSGGFGPSQNTPGGTAGIDVGVRLGLGLEGVMHGGGDGLVFFEFGWRQDAATTMSYGSTPLLDLGGQFTAAIPSREAYITRLRMPFYLIPLDLLVTAPILLWVSPNTFANMAVTAGLGGLIPWQAGIETSIGRFQFILGREIGVTFYGRSKNPDALLIPLEGETALLNFRSTQFDFPIVEYRPFRTFSIDQSSSLVIQFNFGVDFPHNARMVFPEEAAFPDLKPVWYTGIRTAFDWRYYW